MYSEEIIFSNLHIYFFTVKLISKLIIIII